MYFYPSHLKNELTWQRKKMHQKGNQLKSLTVSQFKCSVHLGNMADDTSRYGLPHSQLHNDSTSAALNVELFIETCIRLIHKRVSPYAHHHEYRSFWRFFIVFHFRLTSPIYILV